MTTRVAQESVPSTAEVYGVARDIIAAAGHGDKLAPTLRSFQLAGTICPDLSEFRSAVSGKWVT